jgi:hypothetical protein
MKQQLHGIDNFLERLIITVKKKRENSESKVGLILLLLPSLFLHVWQSADP